MPLLMYATLILSTLATCNACSCQPGHPQENFCDAHFVIRAKVLSQGVVPGEYYDKRVYNLRILKTYKGAVGLNQTKDIRPHGSKQRSLFTKAYTSVGEKECGIKLANDTVYLLTGTISGQKLRIGKCKWVQRWADVTPRQRMGIRRFYGDNCDCQISPCYAESCKKLQGCRKSGNFYYSDCEWRHSYCLVNADKSACAWRETEEYKKCMNELVIP